MATCMHFYPATTIEGVQIGVKHPHHYLGLDMLTRNVTNFIADNRKD
jgi:hypothetical protein